MFTKKAGEVADKIKTEVGKAGQYVTLAVCMSAVALLITVAVFVSIHLAGR